MVGVEMPGGGRGQGPCPQLVARPLWLGDDDRAWCLAQLSLSKCLAVSVFLGACKRHENDLRKQVVLAKCCVKCPASRSAWEETFLGRAEGEEEGNRFFTALQQHLSRFTT